MTTHHPSPEDAFDQWLDDLMDGEEVSHDDERAHTASFLQRSLGLSQSFAASPPESSADADSNDVSSANFGAAANPASIDQHFTPPIRIERSRKPAWRIASLASAAVLALIALATITAFLRLDDDNQGGVGTMLPFAPSAALASPTPAANCATDDTLLVMPDEPIDAGAFAHLPFPIAWYTDGTITVEHRGTVQREIAVDNVDVISATGWPDVLVTGTTEFPDQRGFVNIITGEMIEVGASVRDVYTPGPFHFWAPDPELNEWNVIDLRTFERISLSDRFAFDPNRPWTPSIFFGQQIGQAGTVLLLETALVSSISVPRPNEAATPASSELPLFDVASNALLIDGSLDAISAVGPLAIANGDMALSPDGDTISWLAPSDVAGERVLTIAEAATGKVLDTRSLQAHEQPSIRFTSDSTRLVVVSGTSLDFITIQSDIVTPVTATDSIQLPAEGFRIIAMTPDAGQVLLGQGNPTVADAGQLIWMNLDTGETREFTGQVEPGQLLAPGSVRTIATNGTHVVLDDFESTLRILDLETGEVIATLDRIAGQGSLTILNDTDRLLIPRPGAIDILKLSSGEQEMIDLPGDYDEAPWIFTATDEQCAVALQHESGLVEAITIIDPATGTTYDLPNVDRAWWLAASP